MRPTTAAVLLALPLSACIDNEEEITIRADGSVDVFVAAKGDIADLADGFPVPLDADWEPVGDDTARWLEHYGPDTGSDAVRRAAGSLDWKQLGGEDPDKVRLSVRAHFDSVEDWPRWFAPATQPYATAFLERSATLSIERRGKYTVYTFERTYHGRHHSLTDVFDSSAQALPSALTDKFEHEEALTEPELQYLTGVLLEFCVRSGEHFAAESIRALGAEEVPVLEPDAVRRVLRGVRESAEQVISLERVRTIVERLQLGEEEDQGNPLEELGHDLRVALRAALADGLSHEAVGVPTRNAVLARLEWNFTAEDHTTDLRDEKFAVRVRMPGTIVSGNYASVSDGSATWEFEVDKTILEDDLVVRVVSIVD